MQFQKYGTDAEIKSVFANGNQEVSILLEGDDVITLKIAEAASLAVELNKAVDDAIKVILSDVADIRTSGEQ